MHQVPMKHNSLGRLNKKLKRRSRLATLFSIPKNGLHFIIILLSEQDKEWKNAKIYLTMKP